MSATGAALGVLALGVVLTGAAVAAVALRRVLDPGAAGTRARLVELLLAHVVVVLVALGLGTAGLLTRGALVTAGAVAGAVGGAALLRGPRSADRLPDGPASSEPTWVRLAAGVAVGVVAVQWTSVLPSALRTGVLGVDAQHYHLPWSAHFARTASTTDVVRLSVPDPPAFYPVHDELLQGVALVLLGSDAATLVWGLVGLVGALLAAAVLGHAWGAPGTAVLGVCVALGLTGSVVGDLNDWAATWPLLAGLALLSDRAGPVGRRTAVLVGLAAGLAAATKLSSLGPALLLVAAAASAGPGRRLASASSATAAALLVGAYWYVRNAVATGSPMPLLDLTVGPVSLPRVPMPELDAVSASAASYLRDGDVVREWYLPGLQAAFGPGWPLLLGAALAGLVAGAAGGARGRRPAAAAGAVSVLAWLTGPTSAAGPPGQPVLFSLNLRYALLGWALGLLLLVTSGPLRRRPVVATALLTASLTSALTRDGAWPQGLAPTAVAAVAAVATGGLVLPRLRPRFRVAALCATVVALAAAAVPLELQYLETRYRQQDSPRQALHDAAQDLPSSGTGVVGFPLLHPFAGADGRTPTRYLGVLEDDGRFREALDCSELLGAAAGLDLVAVQLQNRSSVPPPALAWLRGADGVRELFSNEVGALFALPDDLQPQDCAR